MRRRHGNRWATCAIALVVVASAVGCKPPPFRSTQGTWTVGTITRDGLNRYDFVDQGSGLRGTAPASNRGGNLRMVAVKHGTATSLNQTSCVTWHGPLASTVQPGIVLRARLDADRTRAIMVTNNIIFGVRSGVNIHVADTARSPAYTGVGQANMTASLGHYQNLNAAPWRFCARVIGATLTVKTWSTSVHPTEPAWNDPTYTATVHLPPSAVVAGKPGVYLGHVPPGQATVLSNHTTRTN